MKYAKEKYITIRHPKTGAGVQAIPTGQTNGKQAEVLVISPGSNLWKIWIKRGDILEEQHPWG